MKKKKTITLKNVTFYKPKSKGSKEGREVEKEHTPNQKVQNIIAGNHEDEFKGYYPALKKMEKKLNRNKRGK